MDVDVGADVDVDVDVGANVDADVGDDVGADDVFSIIPLLYESLLLSYSK
ncbi:hypothetical protein RCG23_02585 [Neobacillus sp. PS3-34]|nr:hypothetical protein [Neobacillus sp. PS3-34]WML49013.1 hypothetical protein RCG23_02585 [Neobacillus sp. PS3-34]